SFAQHRLWLLERLQPSGAAYNLVLALRLSGPLDPAALAVALAGVVDRHEVLRTRFSETAGGPWQEVLPAWAPALPVIDFGSVPAALRDEALRQLAQAAVRQPFDLAAAPPLRACLLRLEPGEHLFLLTLHHAVSDGLSQDILRRELAALYTAAAEGRPSPLPGLALQYADYALWQREWLGGETLAEQLLVWRRRLAGVPALELPTDRPRPAVWTFRGAVHSAPLSADLAAALHRLARREGATPFMVVLAAFQTLLGRTSGQDDFAVGSPSANRRPEVEGMVGFFVNMLPLRASLSGAPAFRGLLARVREAALEAYGHQDLPFERLVEELAPERDLGRNPVFQVTFQLFHEAPPPAFAGLATAAVDPGTGTAKFDLSLEVVEGGGGLTAVWEYATDLFDAATVRRLAGHLGSLLAGALAAPETGLEDLPWLGAAERHQLLLEWNDTTGEPLQAEGVHRLVAQQARRRPEALAVAAGGEELTYGELVHRAGLLARRLRGLGAGPEVLV
ncbi:MAG TPA: condensation domain-containing protein, partial [Actinomycetes bacterium]